jgi:hypothetical protein
MAKKPNPSGNGQRSNAKRRKPPHRPHALTEEKIEAVANYLRLGMYQTQAAILAGIPRSSYFMYKAKAEELSEVRDDPTIPNPKDPWELLLLDFSDSIQKAMAEGEALLLRRIYDAADPEKGDRWQAAAWILERSRPDRWARRDRHEFTGEGGGPIVVTGEVDPDDTNRMDAILAVLGEISDSEAAEESG